MRKQAKGSDLVFVKLGGAAITDKTGESKVNTEVLSRVSKEISGIAGEFKLVIGHGSGSFGHPVAKKYKVQEGLDVCGSEGFVKTHEAASKLNSIVVKHLLDAGVPAVPIQTQECTTMDNGKITDMACGQIENFLETGFVPVIYGDVVPDTKKGCSIASTEMILKFLAKKLHPTRVIIGTDVDGVFTKDPKQGKAELVPEITGQNINEVLEMVSAASTTDVTGGMAHKVEELYELAKTGIEVRIINILKGQNLEKAIRGEKIGTILH